MSTQVDAAAQQQMRMHIEQIFAKYQGMGIYNNWDEFSRLVRDPNTGTAPHHSQAERQLGAELQSLRLQMEGYGASWQMYGLTTEQRQAFIREAAQRTAEAQAQSATPSTSSNAAAPRNALSQMVTSHAPAGQAEAALLEKVMGLPAGPSAPARPTNAKVMDLPTPQAPSAPAPQQPVPLPAPEAPQPPGGAEPSLDVIAQKLDLLLGAVAAKSLGGMGLQPDETSNIASLLTAYEIDPGSQREQVVIAYLRYLVIPLMREAGIVSLSIQPAMPVPTEDGVQFMHIDTDNPQELSSWWEMLRHFRGFQPNAQP